MLWNKKEKRPYGVNEALGPFEVDMLAFVNGQMPWSEYEWAFEVRYRADMDLYNHAAQTVMGPYRIQCDSAIADNPDPERGEITVDELREITRQLLADWHAGLL